MARTMSARTSTARAREAGQEVANSPWVDRGARLGFAARGLVYIVIGLLAVQIAAGHRSRQADKQGALQAIADKPLGEAVLVVLAVGLAGYALWRFTEAIWGYASETEHSKRIAKRIGSAGKGLLYAAFCVTTISVLAGSGGGGGGDQSQKHWTAKVLGWPGGRVLVGLVGAAVIVGGAYMVYRGATRKFEKKLDMARMGQGWHRLAEVLGTFGNSARGVVFGLIGLLLIKAALDYRPDEAQGIDGTLRTIAARPYGQVLLILAAVGLMAFGLFSFIEARYRRL